MKLKIVYWCLLICVAGSACKKYIDKTNPDQLTDPEFWKDENSVRAYSWEFYNQFMGYGNGSSTNGDFYFTPNFNDDQASQGFTQYPLNTAASDGDWAFNYVRKANIMLERIDKLDIPDEAKNHWKGIARFFRAFQYFKLVQKFGGVPWINKSMELSDTTLIYKPRDTHQLVMDSVLQDLNFAVANIRQNDGANAVNKDVAQSFKSRVCLFEGTYRKYHTEYGMPDADKWLLAAKDAAAAVMARPYSLSPDYQNIYNNDNLANHPEIILYKRYEPNYLMHSVIAYLYSSTVINGLTKNAVESYLCTDGLPIGLSPLYKGDDTTSTMPMVVNRDKRLKITIDTTYLYYIGHTKGGLTSSTGYRITKYLPDTARLKTIQTGINTNVTDAPIFYLSEVLLNYIEAAAELDEMGAYALTQADINNTINKLRARAGVAPMTLAGKQNPGFTDPKKDATVTSLIWEIRRERRVELMTNGFRQQDLYRWKKGEYIDSKKNPDVFLGAKANYNKDVKRNAQGYIMPYTAAQQREFTDPKHYLSAIPTNQILLYPAALQPSMQNTGW